MKAKLIEHGKTTDELGNTIEVKIWKVPKSKDKPNGYKYSLVYIVHGARIICYDNAEGKGDHRHCGNKEEGYEFKNSRYPASKASVEGEAPSGFAGGGGDASPYDR